MLGLSGAPAYALPPPPPNPSDSQLSGAAAQQQAVAAQVSALSAQLAQAEAQLQQMQDQLQEAQELYNKAVVDLQMAQDKAVETKAAVAQADADVVTATAKVQDFARSSYIQGSSLDSDTVLLSAEGPTQLIQQAAFLDAIAKTNLTAMQQLQVAKAAQANADSQARLAVQLMTIAEANAQAAKQQAEDAVAASEAAKTQVEASKATTEQQLAAAQAALADLQGQRGQYNQWLAQKQAEEAAAAAAAAEAARVARVQAQQQAAAAAAAAQASGGGGGGTASVVAGPAPGGRGWTAAKGQYAANLAQQWLGTQYAWGGGTVSGPSRGVRDGGVADSYGDYRKTGFDCSGLALYAWGNAGISLSHYSGYQYTSGRVHPSVSQLLPGDLMFWGIGRIHHVAIYIGGGQIVQAPQSGDVVKISSIWMSDYAGATRPGT